MQILRYLLLPISLIYWITIKIRNLLFNLGILKSNTPNIKTICIGNITVGGTGKTPHTEYLIKLLASDYQIAVLSRGYKRKTNGYLEAEIKSTSNQIGDEPLQMKLKFPHITVAVDKDRTNGIAMLQKNHKNLEVILLDDAFQHRSVKAGLSALLTDYSNLICNDTMIPTGTLRDSFAERKRADIIVVTKCPKDISTKQMEQIRVKLKLKPNQSVFFSYIEYGQLKPVFEDADSSISMDSSTPIIALSGIAKPTPFIKYLENNSKLINKQVYSDHHSFTEPEIRAIFEPYSSNLTNAPLLITTEKDAARIRGLELNKEIKKKMYFLEIEVKFIDQPESFNDKIIQYVREN